MERDDVKSLDLLCALAKLTMLEREVVVDTCVLGDTQGEIAARCRVSRPVVYRARKRGLAKLRDELRVPA